MPNRMNRLRAGSSLAPGLCAGMPVGNVIHSVSPRGNRALNTWAANEARRRLLQDPVKVHNDCTLID